MKDNAWGSNLLVNYSTGIVITSHFSVPFLPLILLVFVPHKSFHIQPRKTTVFDQVPHHGRGTDACFGLKNHISLDFPLYN